MNPFTFLDYRKLVLEIVQLRQKPGSRIPYSEIAKAAKIQPTYFSNVLKGRADFSADQLYAILDFLSVPEAELDYALQLLEWQRCSHPKRKKALRAQIEEVRTRHLATKNAVEAKPLDIQTAEDAFYYLDAYAQLVHIFLSIPKYAKEPSLIRRSLPISEEHLQDILKSLSTLGLIVITSAGVQRKSVPHRHLPDDSNLCRPHQSVVRLASLQQIQRVPRNRARIVSVSFSADENARIAIQERFMQFLGDCQKHVQDATPERVYQLNFDLFPWEVET